MWMLPMLRQFLTSVVQGFPQLEAAFYQGHSVALSGSTQHGLVQALPDFIQIFCFHVSYRDLCHRLMMSSLGKCFLCLV